MAQKITLHTPFEQGTKSKGTGYNSYTHAAIAIFCEHSINKKRDNVNIISLGLSDSYQKKATLFSLKPKFKPE